MPASPDSVVFVDFDGTLLTSKRVLTDRTRLSLAVAAAGSLEVAAASSRPLVGLRLQGAPQLKTSIALNGAVVRTEYGRSWDAPPLHAGDVDKILAAVAPFRCAVNLYSAGRWYTSNSADPRVRDEAQRLGVSPDAFDNGLAHEFHKILLLAGPDVLSRCERVLQDIPPATRLRWFRSEPSYLEIGRADVTKGGGALVVKDWLQPRRTYAIGDGYSDITLFRAVDVAIAVANAPRVVRDAAHVTVASNDADGVAEAITRILDGEL